MDVDSGIETMEVDDSDMKFEIKRRRVYALITDVLGANSNLIHYHIIYCSK